MGGHFQSIRKHARQAQPRAVPHVTRRPRADAAAERGRKRLPCSARVSGAGSNSRTASDDLTPLTRTGRLRCGHTSCHLHSRNRFIFQTKNFFHFATGAPSARTVLLARRADCGAKDTSGEPLASPVGPPHYHSGAGASSCALALANFPPQNPTAMNPLQAVSEKAR